MCFSATASFTAATVLVPPSIYYVHKSYRRNRSYLPLAVLPLGFGIQQLIEGFVWRSSLCGETLPLKMASLGFLFFAFFLWPILCPIAAFSPRASKIFYRWRSLFIIFGIALGALIYVPLLFGETTFTTTIVNHSILYETSRSVLQKVIYTVLYFAVTVIPFFFSHDRMVKLFGLLIFASAVATMIWARYAFFSIWCFFAALLSMYIWIVIQIRAVEK